MLEALKTWWRERFGDDAEDDLPRVNRTGSFPPRDLSQGTPDPARRAAAKDSAGNPGQEGDVLIRNRFVREETGTHETLKILDDSLIDSGEEAGIDPYNTGGFDRSRNWESRSRK